MEIYKAKQAPSTTLYIYMVSTQEVRYEMRYGWNRNSPLVFKKTKGCENTALYSLILSVHPPILLNLLLSWL